MSKMSKAIVALGVVAGLGVAALPLSSYAYNVSTKDVTVTTEVEGAISIGTDKTTVNLGTLKLNGVAQGENAGTDNKVTVTVTGNSATAYDLKISAPNGTEMKNAEKNTSIPAITTPVATLAGGDNSWGYKVDTGNWTGVPATATTIKTVAVGDWTAGSEGVDPTSTADVLFGATAGSTLAEGTYTGSVVFTATTKD